MGPSQGLLLTRALQSAAPRGRTAALMERSTTMLSPNSSGRYASVPRLRRRTTTVALAQPVRTSPLVLPVSVRPVLLTFAPWRARSVRWRGGVSGALAARRGRRGAKQQCAAPCAHQREAQRHQHGRLAGAVSAHDEVDARVEVDLQVGVVHEVDHLQALDVARRRVRVGVHVRLRLRQRQHGARLRRRRRRAARRAAQRRAAAAGEDARWIGGP